MSNEKEISSIFEEIEMKSLTNDFVYRGEPEHYPKASSNLYRQYQDDIDGEHFDIKVVQDEILKELRLYTTPHDMIPSDKFSLMAQLQHYGGTTNFIDFTKDYRIALFFACNGSPKEDGRIILKVKLSIKEYEIYEPYSPKNRIIAQKSIFIHPTKGWLDLTHEEVISIPANLKESLLEHLSKFYDISTSTIYNDLHGFIKNKQIHKDAYTEFYMGITALNKAREKKETSERKFHFNKAITHFDQSIQYNPQISASFINRGIAKYEIEEYEDALVDQTKAIELNPKEAGYYHSRGITKISMKKYEEAIVDFDKSIELNPEDPDSYFGRGYTKQLLSDLTAKNDYALALSLAETRGDAELVDKARRALDNYPSTKD